MFETVKETAQTLDNFFLELGKKMSIVVLPGQNDPSDSFIPQQQLSRFLFYKSTQNLNF